MKRSTICMLLMTFASVILSLELNAQCNLAVTLSSQADVNAFPTKYPCIIWENDLTISGPDITDLSPLSDLIEVRGKLTIGDNPLLESLNGLSLEIMEHFTLKSNSALSTLDGLETFRIVRGWFVIEDNDGLLDLEGISQMEYAGAFELNDNHAFTHLPSFQNFEMDQLTISNNANLLEIDGQGFTPTNTDAGASISGNFSLETVKNCLDWNSEYTSISNNNSLASITNCTFDPFDFGSVRISNNPSLHTIEATIDEGGLSLISNSSLTDIGIDLNSDSREFRVENNDALTSLEGFNLSIDSPVDVSIEGNEALRNIDVLSTVYGIRDFKLKDNTNLSNCCAIPCILELIEGQVEISGNSLNCLSLPAIQDNCQNEYCTNLIDRCTNLIFNAEVICADEIESIYMVILSFAGADVHGYTVINDATGESESFETASTIFYSGFTLNSSFSYTLSMNSDPNCAINVSSQMTDCVTSTIDLITFEGAAFNTGNLIKWETAREDKCTAFILQRSEDGHTFKNVANLNCVGNSNTMEAYEHLDVDYRSELSYYRLLELNEKNETKIASDVIAVKRPEALTIRANIFPVPATDWIKVKFDKPIEQEVHVEIYDQTGMLTASYVAFEKQYRRIINLNVSELSSGLYFICINVEDQKITGRFTK